MSTSSKRAASAVDAPGESRETDRALLVETTDPEIVRGAIGSETRAWAGALLMFGVVQLIPGTSLDHAWGFVLILASGMAYYFRNAAMLPAFGVLIVWAMISNLLSGQLLWTGLAAFQAYLAYRTFRQFVLLRRAAYRAGIGLEAESLHRADVLLPWAGFALTSVSWVGFLVWWAVIFSYALNEQSPSEQALGTAADALLDVAILGLALAMASIAARYRFRALSIVALLGSGLLLVSFVALSILGSNV